MKRASRRTSHAAVLAGAAALLALAASACASAGAAAIKAGVAAPPFALMGSDGKTHSLADHAGKVAVVLAWFPKAFTGG